MDGCRFLLNSLILYFFASFSMLGNEKRNVFLCFYVFIDPKNKNKPEFVAVPVHVKERRQKGK